MTLVSVDGIRQERALSPASVGLDHFQDETEMEYPICWLCSKQ